MDFKPRNIPIQNIQPLVYGLNTKLDPSMIQDAEMADCENFSIDDGIMSTSPGYIGWDNNPAPGPYWGGFTFTKTDGSIVNVRQRQDTLEYAPDGDSDWFPCTMPNVGSPASPLTLTQCQPTFAALNNIIIFTNGHESVLSSTDGITWAAQASLPKCKVVVENAKNRLLYLAQTDSNKQFRFDWSNINDPLTIDAESYSLVDPNNNGFIVGAGLTPNGTTLIFKELGVYEVSDYVDNGIIDINFIGATKCASHQSIATTNNSVIWHSMDGVSEYIGGTIRQIMGRISMIGRNDVARADLFCGAFYNNKYFLSIPDADVSTDYNSQEYIFHLNIGRQDSEQPYAITRNRRYIGCYFKEFAVFDYGADNTLYIGDSRPATTSGSPAVYDNMVFGWINDYRDTDFGDGLDGEAQTCFFTTKYFTKSVPYYAKKFKRIFANLKITSNATFKVSYRFLPYGAWTDIDATIEVAQLEFLEGYGFSEGYGFAQDSLESIFIDMNNPEKPRGIQFKFETTTIKDISILSMAFSYMLKGKFK